MFGQKSKNKKEEEEERKKKSKPMVIQPRHSAPVYDPTSLFLRAVFFFKKSQIQPLFCISGLSVSVYILLFVI